MRKIPVGETISAAYSFAFTGFLSVLGTVWLPYLLLLIIDAGLVMLLAPELPGRLMRGDIDASLIQQLQHFNNVAWIPSLIVGSMIVVGLQERALGRVQGPTFFYFSLGAPVWRMIGAWILLFLLLLLIVLLLALGVGVLWYVAVNFIPVVGKAIAIIAAIAAVCWYIYAIVRLAFFLPAVVVAENQIGLGRAWELGRGNFWRIFAVWFVVTVPVAIAFYIVLIAVMGPVFSGLQLPHVHQNMSPDDMREFYVSLVRAMSHKLGHIWPFLFVLGFLGSTLLRGLLNGAIGKAYVAVANDGSMQS